MRDRFPRRSFLSGVSAALAAVGLGSTSARAETGVSAFQPARHQEDEWFDKLPGKHRVFVDASSAAGASDALMFARNLYTANANGYSLKEGDLAIIVCLRHRATAFAFNDAMWSKYGKAWSTQLNYTDPKTKEAPTSNLLAAGIDELLKKGTAFAICDMATHARARASAQATGGDADEVYKELVGHAITGGRFVPAGVVAVNRAQEYGYSLLVAG
jgi:hypothetical protein